MSGYLPVFKYPWKLKTDTFANLETSKTGRTLKQKRGSWGPDPEKC